MLLFIRFLLVTTLLITYFGCLGCNFCYPNNFSNNIIFLDKQKPLRSTTQIAQLTLIPIDIKNKNIDDLIYGFNYTSTYDETTKTNQIVFRVVDEKNELFKNDPNYSFTWCFNKDKVRRKHYTSFFMPIAYHTYLDSGEYSVLLYVIKEGKVLAVFERKIYLLNVPDKSI